MRISIVALDKDDRSTIDIESDIEAVKPILLIIKKMIMNVSGSRSMLLKPYIESIYDYTYNKLLDGISFEVSTKHGKIPVSFKTRQILIEGGEHNEQQQ